MMTPTAFGWIDHEVSAAPEWDAARLARFARHLGYRIVWPNELSVLPVADQARDVGADAVIMPALDHLGLLELNRVMHVADVEVMHPRLSFARWHAAGSAR